jgi:hypothetical protein
MSELKEIERERSSDDTERKRSSYPPKPHIRIEHPPLKLRPKRRVLFPDTIEFRRPRRRPKPAAPVTPTQPARLPTIAPTQAASPAVPTPAAPTPVNQSVAVLDETPASRARPRNVITATSPADYVERTPMYWRLLRLRYVRPNGWLRALFVEGSVGLAVVLVLAEKASIWTILALPVAVAVLVKTNDLVAGGLQHNR